MRRAIKIAAVVLLVAGLAVAAYPHVLRWLYDRDARQLAREYDQWRQELLEQAGQAPSTAGPGEDPAPEQPEEGVPYLADLYAAMEAYNQGLYENGQAGFRDAWSYQEPSFDLTQWGLEDGGMVGYLEIPRMGIVLPIYLGASTANMEKGAVHLSQTSLPIGGVNTNSVIAAHRGYYGAEMFRHIDQLEIGDEVLVNNLWEELTYQVSEIRVIRPNETDQVLIQEGRDLVTLVSCHPYPYNYQRYVVYCERVSQGGNA